MMLCGNERASRGKDSNNKWSRWNRQIATISNSLSGNRFEDCGIRERDIHASGLHG